MKRNVRMIPTLVLALVVVVAVGFAVKGGAGAGVQLPAPAVDVPAGSDTSAVAVVAGGCFWGVQAVFQHLDGVVTAVLGHTGGEESTATYDAVSSGRTGHAETVRAYDPRRISYGQILQVFFSVAHDPTRLHRQGLDRGPSTAPRSFRRTASMRTSPARTSTSSIASMRSSGRS